jgi:hypothetical protein
MSSHSQRAAQVLSKTEKLPGLRGLILLQALLMANTQALNVHLS